MEEWTMSFLQTEAAEVKSQRYREQHEAQRLTGRTRQQQQQNGKTNFLNKQRWISCFCGEKWLIVVSFAHKIRLFKLTLPQDLALAHNLNISLFPFSFLSLSFVKSEKLKGVTNAMWHCDRPVLASDITDIKYLQAALIRGGTEGEHTHAHTRSPVRRGSELFLFDENSCWTSSVKQSFNGGESE